MDIKVVRMSPEKAANSTDPQQWVPGIYAEYGEGEEGSLTLVIPLHSGELAALRLVTTPREVRLYRVPGAHVPAFCREALKEDSGEGIELTGFPSVIKVVMDHVRFWALEYGLNELWSSERVSV